MAALLLLRSCLFEIYSYYMVITALEGDTQMKKGFSCPACGTVALRNLFLTTHKGKSLSLLLSSQADIRKSSGDVFCVECKQVKRIAEFQVKRRI